MHAGQYERSILIRCLFWFSPSKARNFPLSLASPGLCLRPGTSGKTPPSRLSQWQNELLSAISFFETSAMPQVGYVSWPLGLPFCTQDEGTGNFWQKICRIYEMMIIDRWLWKVIQKKIALEKFVYKTVI